MWATNSMRSVASRPGMVATTLSRSFVTGWNRKAIPRSRNTPRRSRRAPLRLDHDIEARVYRVYTDQFLEQVLDGRGHLRGVFCADTTTLAPTERPGLC